MAVLVVYLVAMDIEVLYVMTLKFWTDKSRQKLQTQARLLLQRTSSAMMYLLCFLLASNLVILTKLDMR